METKVKETKEENLRRKYLEIQVKKYLNKNRGKDLTSLIAGILSSEKERFTLAVEISESTKQLEYMLEISQRTVFRYFTKHNIPSKWDENGKPNKKLN